MGHRYCRPMPCYHGCASLPPSKRSCCRLQPSILIDTREIRSKFGSRDYIQRHRRS